MKVFNIVLIVFSIGLSNQVLSQCPNDNDCDGIVDLDDFDDDNDGMTDIEELSNCIDFSNLSTSGELLYDEDFGSGAGRGPELSPGTISYCFQNGLGSCTQPNWVPAGQFWVTDGQYALLNNPNIGFPDAFRHQEDHTPGDVNGYQVVVNADFFPGEMYRKNNIAIPSSNFQVQTVTISVWISNIGSEANQSYCTNNETLINPNVDFVLEDQFGTPIGTQLSSGDIPFFNNGQDAWIQYTASFQVTGISAVNVVIKNNAPGGCGNDLAIDDISVYYADVDCDFDEDGIADYLDLDSDNDGIYDVIEGGDGTLDTNGDGMINSGDVGFTDLDNDGMDDGGELTVIVDTDGDGLPDYLDLDSDNDGCFDTVEAGFSDVDDNGILGINPVNVDDYGVIQNQSGYSGTMPSVTNSGGNLAPDFSYPQYVFCIGEGTVMPSISSSTIGSYIVSPSGLSLDPLTGEISPSSSSVGIYQVTYTPGEECLNDSTLTITIVDVPMIDPIADIIICEGGLLNAIDFIGTGVTYDWTNSNTTIGIGGSGEGSIAEFTSTINGAEQVATIEVTPSVGICVGDSESFTITLTEQDNSLISYPQLSACQSNDDILANIAGSSNGMFSASPTGLAVDEVTGTISPNTSMEGVYEIMYQSNSNCPSQSIINFEVSVGPTILAMSDISICDGIQIVFPQISTGDPTDIIQWEILPTDLLGIGDSGSNGNIQPVIGVNSGLSPITTTISAFATTSSGCIGPVETFNVTVNPVPEVSFSGDILSGCEAHEVQFSSLMDIPAANCLWEFGNGVTSNLCDQTSATFMAGNYDVSLTVTSHAGCSNTISYEDYIQVYQSPYAAFNFNPGNLDVMNSNVQFNNTSLNASNYVWDFGDNSPSNNEISPSHGYSNVPGVGYTITLWAYDENYQCVDSVQHFITVEDVLIYYVPNTFTPDDDEFNQTFKPVFTAGYDPYDFHLLLFNRWGQIIFESYNADIGWDGTYNGKTSQDGTYTWAIDFKTNSSDERVAVIGHLNLIR